RMDHLSPYEAQIKAKEMGLRILTNKEVDNLLQNEKLSDKYAKYFPCWTGTHVHVVSEGTGWVTEHGKSEKIRLPKNDGWYIVDRKYRLPIGKESNKENPMARFLSLSEHGYFVVRGWDYVDSDFITLSNWRDVALHDHDTHIGVLGTPMKPQRLRLKRTRTKN
ncbi:hypothetical protein HY570_02670, partial [Candidatus Micrarchaeota archaeon]|nr:hypothetical protein [Candidatus Micrarchaeota archaeon]